MSRLVSATFFVVILGAAAAASAQGFGSGPGGRAPDIRLTEDKVNRILAALPEVVAETSAQQAAFMQGMAGGGGAAPEMDAEAIGRVQAVFRKHGYTLQAFGIDVSVLIATYFMLDPAAMERQLPTEKSPEIRAILDDPTVPKAKKDALKLQIGEFQKNKHQVIAGFAALASAHNRKIVKPHLARVAEVMEMMRRVGAKSVAAKPAGPRRKK